MDFISGLCVFKSIKLGCLHGHLESLGELARRSRIRLWLVQVLCACGDADKDIYSLSSVHIGVCLAVTVLCGGFSHFWSSHIALLLDESAKGNSSKQDKK